MLRHHLHFHHFEGNPTYSTVSSNFDLFWKLLLFVLIVVLAILFKNHSFLLCESGSQWLSTAVFYLFLIYVFLPARVVCSHYIMLYETQKDCFTIDIKMIWTKRTISHTVAPHKAPMLLLIKRPSCIIIPSSGRSNITDNLYFTRCFYSGWLMALHLT